MKKHVNKPVIRIMAIGVSTCIAGAAIAEEKKDSDWEISLGVGAGYEPDYEGSDDYELKALPYAKVTWKDRVSLSPGGLKADFIRWDDFTAGVGIGMTDSRKQSDNVALQGLGDIDISAAGMLYASYEWQMLEFGAELEQDLGDGHGGILAKFEANARMPVLEDKLMLSAGPFATWASEDYMQSFFGISAAQAATSKYARFDAGSGFKDVGLQMGARYKFTESISLNAKFEYKQLLGDAADSPIVANEGSADQFGGGLFVSYTF